MLETEYQAARPLSAVANSFGFRIVLVRHFPKEFAGGSLQGRLRSLEVRSAVQGSSIQTLVVSRPSVPRAGLHLMWREPF